MFKHIFLAKVLVFTLILYLTIKFTTSSSNITGFSLKLIPRDSPESPIYFGNLTWTERVQKMIEITHARVQYLRPQDAQMPLYREKNFYIVELMIGTPLMNVYLLMDTGGGLVWTQCMPCINCYRQTSKLFDPRTSSSYRKLPCSHSYCSGPDAVFKCENNQCTYSVTYGAGIGARSGPTKGVASMETVGFYLRTGTVQLIDGIVFGCSVDSVNFQNFENSMVSGIMGLNLAPHSFVSQLAKYVNRRFSYCFTPFDEYHPSPSKITFGEAIPAPRGDVVTVSFFLATEFVVPNFYFYLRLMDITVGWLKLGFPPGTFEFYEEGPGGFIIDSGAIYPILDNVNLLNGRNVYNEVITTFERYYDGKGFRRRAFEPLLFDLCYEMPPDDFKDYLSMTYHFDGGNLLVDGKYAHYFNHAQGYFCVSLIGKPGVSMLGAWHQQNVRVTYDGNINVVQFSHEICS